MLSELVPTMYSTKAPQLWHQVRQLLVRYFHHGERDASLVVPPGETVHVDSSPAWILPMLKMQEPHNLDFHIFRAFTDPEGVVLDIGAHWGYSVGAIWSVGSRCSIVSFEAMEHHSPCLKAIARFYPARYRFKMTGLSDHRGRLRFVAPVIDGKLAGALTTASPQPDLDQLSTDICEHARLWHAGEFSLRLWETEVAVETLDEILASDTSLIQNRSIYAIKIDVEGFEYRVLKGATATLDKYRPLVMAEGGNHDLLLAQYLDRKGYMYAERRAMMLEPVEGLGVERNGFYVHRLRAEEYRRAGILRCDDPW